MKKKAIIIGIMIIFLIILLIIIQVLHRQKEENKHKNEEEIITISRKISEKLEIDFNNKRYTYDKEYSYIDAVEVYNDDVYIDLDDEYEVDSKYTDDCYHLAFRVLKFNSNYEAKSYYNFMKIRWKYMKDNFSNTYFSKSRYYKYYIQHEKDLYIIKNNYLVWLNKKYESKNNIKSIKSILEKYSNKSLKQHNKNDVDKYWAEEQIESEQKFKEVSDEYIEKVSKIKEIKKDSSEQSKNTEVKEETKNEISKSKPSNNNSNSNNSMDALRKCTVMEAADIYTTGGNSGSAFNDAKKQCESWYKQWGEKDFLEVVNEDWNNRQNEQIEGKPLSHYLDVLGW